MMTRWLILLLLGIVMLPLQGFSYEAMTVSDGGTIVGEVKYAGDPPAPEKIDVTKDANICGADPKVSPTLVVGANKGIKDEYHPYAQIIPVNTTLEITNSDDVLHNIKTKGGSKTSFNMAQPKFKRKLTYDFKNPEIVQVECNVHGWMNAIIVVEDNPYDALTDANGSFKITDVPPGKYTVKVWHSKLGEQTKEVTVGPKEEVKVAFEMKAP